METIKIGDGINLHIIDVKKFKTATLLVLFRQPITRADATKRALISNILNNGSQRYGSISKLNTVVDGMYGSVFESQIVKKGEEQLLQFYLDILDGYGLFEHGIEFLKEVILNPLLTFSESSGKGFDNSIVKNEKINMKKIIEGRKNNRIEYAKQRCIEEMCNGEPFGIYGDGNIEDLDGLNGSNLYGAYTEMIRSNPIEVVLVCNRDNINIDEPAKLFDGLQRGEITPLVKPEYKKHITKVKRIDEEIGSAQGKLCLGFRAQVDPTGDMIYPLMVANEILSGGSHSKLFRSAREEESLCYYINSSLYRFKSIILVQTGVARENFDRVVNLTESCIDEIKKGAITEDELTNAKKTLKNIYTGINDNPSSIADFNLTQYMLSDDRNMLDRLDAVDIDSVCSSFNDIELDTIYTLV